MLSGGCLAARADTLLVVDQDTIDAALATALILREAAHLVVRALSLALSVVGGGHLGRVGGCVVHRALLRDVAVLERAVLGRRQHHALAVLRCSGGRLIEIEDSLQCVLLARVVLVAKFWTGSRGCERLDRPALLLEVLLDRHVAHESTLGRLDLIEELSLVADLDGEHLRRLASYERSVLL